MDRLASGQSAAAPVKDGTNKEKDVVALKLRLFVGGLGATVNPRDLQERFAPLGLVHGIHMVKSKNENDVTHRGFAYVDFEASSDASLRKLFSAYNGCKWKGGVLRVEKAKEHYTDRLSREWAQAEATKSTEYQSQQPADNISKGPVTKEVPFLLTEPLKIPIPFSKKVRLVPPKGTGRHKRSFQYFPSLPVDELTREISPARHAKQKKLVGSEDVFQDFRNTKHELVTEVGEQDDVDDEIAAQIAKERKRQLNLLSKLFPDDNEGVGEEERLSVEVLPSPTVLKSSNKGAKKQKPKPEKAPERLKELSQDMHVVHPTKQNPLGYTPHEQESSLHKIAKQKSTNPRVTFAEDGDVDFGLFTEEARAPKENNHGILLESVNVTQSLRPILKKESQKLAASDKYSDEDEGKDEDNEDEDQESPMEEEYYTSSRSPSPETELSIESKWVRLFKHASVKKGPVVVGPGEGGIFTGISLDDDEPEPAVHLIQASALGDQAEVKADKTGPLAQKVRQKAASGLAKPKKLSVKNSILSPDLSHGNVPHALASDPHVDGQSDLESKDASMEDYSYRTSSDYEDVNEDLGSSDKETSHSLDSNEDSDSSVDEFMDVEAEPLQTSASSLPVSEAAKSSTWENMFKSAMGVKEPLQGAFFSGSLDDPENKDDVMGVRPTIKRNMMFKSAAVLEPENVAKVLSVSKIIRSGISEHHVDEGNVKLANQTSLEEDAIGTSEDVNGETVKEDDVGESEDEGGGVHDMQKRGDNVGSNLLARFDLEQDKRNTSTSLMLEVDAPQSTCNVQGTEPGECQDKTEQFDENSKWVQRASWKSLVGADGRVDFTLKELTGEQPDVKQVTGKRKMEEQKTPEQPFTFNFNFARTNSEPLETKIPQPLKRSVGRRAAKPVGESKLDGTQKDDTKLGGSGFKGVDGCLFMKSDSAEQEWRASKSEIRMDSKAKHKAAVRSMKKLRGSGCTR